MVRLTAVHGKRWVIVWEIVGILHLVLSMTLSVYCLGIFDPYLQNDFFWPGFESLNTSQILTSVYNTQLTLATNGTIDLYSPATSVFQASSELQINPVYPRMVLYQDLTTIEAGIDQLRRLDIASTTFIQSPYCWLDMNRQWEMAHTLLRQSRCKNRYNSNAAVYFEVLLRNINFAGWLALNAARFNERIGFPIQELPGGSLWLNKLKQHTLLDVQDEANTWISYNMTYFSQQFGNLGNPGIEETIAIENAMGSVKLYRIKSTPYTVSTIWTSLSIYCPIECDFVGLPTNQSLIRNTTKFWADINPNALEAFGAGYPLSLLHQVVHDEIGPLMSIDVRWVAPPLKLVSAVQSFRSQVLTLLSTDRLAQSIFVSLPTLELTPTPNQWKNIFSYGGNPMCHNGAPLPFAQQSFAFNDACGSQTPLKLIANPMNALFASAIVGRDYAHTCLLCLPTEQIECLSQADSVTQLSKYISQINSSYFLESTIADISYLQFVAPTTNSTYASLSTQPLLASNWAYFGYMSMYDWVMNEKEVLVFEGDLSTIRLMSAAYTPVNSKASTLKSTLAIYLWYLTALLTLVLVIVAASLIVASLVYSYMGCQWINFNRIVGCVWLNRTVLLVRSSAAIFCLATAPLQPTANGLLLPLSHISRSWFISGLLAGETTWLTYVCQEFIQPIAYSMPSRYIHLISFLVWMLIWSLNVAYPVQPLASFQRDCYSVEMATMIYCSSGYLQIGFYSRVYLIVAINLITVLVLTILFRSHTNGKYSTNGSLLITAAAVSCLSDTSDFKMNPIISAMCGIIDFTYNGLKYTFDTKLWLRISDKPNEPDAVLPFASHLIPVTTLAMTSLRNSRVTWEKFTVAAGFIYLALTLVGNITYLDIVQENLANDFFWAGFNSTGMHVFIANLLNRQALLDAHQHLQLDNSSFGDWANLYNNDESSIQWGANAARRQLFSPNVSLYDIIQGLRTMEPNQLPWMFTQYCWLDFNQTWEMATTSRRQTRCLQASNNGAVYLESGLRNIMDWTQWDNSWGTSFNTSFRLDLETTKSGRTWLNSIEAAERLTIKDEVMFWQNHNITRFELQWQNYKSLGMSDTMLIENALGLQYPMQISYIEGSIHTHQQTSFRLYWTLASDLWAVSSNISSICGKSLLRHSPRFAFVNSTSESLLFENFTLTAPLRSGLVSFRNIIGPFNSVDTKYLSCPASLLHFFGDIMASFTSLLLSNDSIQNAFLNLTVPALTYYAPRVLSKDATAFIVGGSIMCGDDNAAYPASVAFFQYFGTDTLCSNAISEQIFLTEMEMAYALMAFNWTSTSSDIADICSLNNAATPSCPRFYNEFHSFLQIITPLLNYLKPLSQKAYDDVQSLVVEITQYVIVNGSSPQLFHMNIFDPNDQPWGFYGWCLAYEWVTGSREVVSFQGDVGTINSISQYTFPRTLAPDPVQIPVTFSFFGQYCSRYITIVIICVAALLVVNTFVVRGQIEGCNLMVVNRMVGLVWIGRSLLVIRSVLALCLLNTTTLQLVQTGEFVRFISPPLPWYKAILAAAEVTWLVYVLNDIFSCVTVQYTSLYAAKSSHLAWLTTIIWVLTIPQQHECSINRQCTRVNMDLALDCTTGVIEIGSVARLKIASGVAAVCVFVCYFIDRWRYPNYQRIDTQIFSLTAQSFYLLHLEKWKHEGINYIDSTSAIMAGILAVQYRKQWYVFDIKTWRLHVRPVLQLNVSHTRFEHALPLQGL